MILFYFRIIIHICPNLVYMPTPVTARSKAWVCHRSHADSVGSNPAGGISISCECCVLSDRGLSSGPITRPECGVSECDRETSIMRRPWPIRGSCAMKKKNFYRYINYASV